MPPSSFSLYPVKIIFAIVRVDILPEVLRLHRQTSMGASATTTHPMATWAFRLEPSAGGVASRTYTEREQEKLPFSIDT